MRPMKRITSEYSQAVFNLPWLVAQEEGFFAEVGLEVEFIRGRQRDPTLPAENDPSKIDPFWRHAPFEEGQATVFNACEWGQIRRSDDSRIGGRIIMLRPAVVSQGLFVRPDSPLSHPQDLRDKTIAVNFHAGSHYLSLQMLEGFMARDEIKCVHLGQAENRYKAMLAGEVDCAALMEPYIAVAEKAGCALIMEAYYAGSEMATLDMDEETALAIDRAIRKAVRAINADKRRYLHHLKADVPADLGPLSTDDFRLSRLRYLDPRPYPAEEFERTHQWLVSWGLVSPEATYEELVDNRIGLR